MPGLDTSALPPDLRETGARAAALLHALARDEAAGRRPERLTEARLGTWTRFRGRLWAEADVLEEQLKDREEDVIRRIESGARVDGKATVITRRRQNISWLTIVKRELGTKAIEEAKNSWPMSFSKELRVA